MVDYNARKASTLPVQTVVDEADQILIVADGAPPDLKLATIDALAELAGSHAPQGIQGETGDVGPTGPPGRDLAVKGSVPTFAALPTTGVVDGDTYVTANDGKLYVYDSGSTPQWTAIATAVGPAGPTGATGPPGATGATGPQGVQGPAGVGIAGASVPIGTILDFVGVTAPAGFLLCDGTEKPQASYPELAAMLALAGWPPATIVGNFKLPNLRGKVTVGLDPDDTYFGALGKSGGDKRAYAIDHSHPAGTLSMSQHDHSVDIWSGYVNLNHGHTFTTAPAGAHNHDIPHGSLLWRYNPNGSEGATSTAITGQRRDNITHTDVGNHQHTGTTDGVNGAGATWDIRVPVNGRTGLQGGAVTGATANAGLDGTNRNVQPHTVVNKIIRATV